MPIISVEENENNRWMRSAKNKNAKITTTKKNKDTKKRKGGDRCYSKRKS